MGKPVTFSREAKQAYLDFGAGKEAIWPANFRDLNNSIARMAILSEGNRIGTEDVKREVSRLKFEWAETEAPEFSSEMDSLIGRHAGEIDLFDRIQLVEVLKVCRKSNNLAEAGRKLFGESRKRRGKFNDTDRLRKYLQRFNLTWEEISEN